MDDKKNDLTTEFRLLVVIGLALLYKILLRFWLWFLVWIKNPVHSGSIIVVSLAAFWISGFHLLKKFKQKRAKKKKEEAVLGKSPDAVYCGLNDQKEEVFIKTKQRIMHTQVIGTTNAGKTESVILPWAIQDMKKGRGLILIDGKADNSMLDKLWGYAVKFGREKDFKLFSLSHPDSSFPFNPLIGGTAEEITERVFNAFEFENPYYRAIQYEVMGQMMRILEGNNITPTFQRLSQLMTDLPALEKQADSIEDARLRNWVLSYKELSRTDREMRTSGLLSAIGQFANGKAASLFNSDKNAIKLDEVLSKNQIVYFQLPVLLSPFLGKATGKLVLQSLQAAVSNRHRGRGGENRFLSVFLDDFSEYLYPGFVSILNKTRSANVGIVFAHQAMGDLTILGEPIANTILTNSNLKVFMRGNDPTSAEYFSKVIGTQTGTKFTERSKRGMFNRIDNSGDLSTREVEEFIVHPNSFKRDLGVGQGIMLIPHDDGAKTVKVKFQMFPEVKGKALPKVEKESLELLETPPPKAKDEPGNPNVPSTKRQEAFNTSAVKDSNSQLAKEAS